MRTSWTLTRLTRAARLLVSLAVAFNLSASTSIAAITATQIASGITAPQSGLILSGTAINPLTGQPFRHIWYGDHVNGLCRLDPDVDTPGPHTLNPATCIQFITNLGQFKPGQFAFDPATNNIYGVDLRTKAQGIVRLHFLPAGDSGHGILDVAHQEVLGGFGSCGLAANVPDSAALGPDGNLYVGFSHSGNILRVVSPATDPLPCTNIQLIGSTADGITNVGLAWVGHDLFGADGQSPWTIPNADQCLTPANGMLTCHGVAILGGQVALPSAVVSDQVYPRLNGSQVYFANADTVTVLQVKPSQHVFPGYATSFQFISGLIVDTAQPGNEVLYVGDDPSNGLNPGQGRWSQLASGPASAPPTTPAVPTGVVARAANAQATVTWIPPVSDGGSPITGYTVASSPPGGSASVPASATSATIVGLTNGTAYTFTVTAINAIGPSLASSPSTSVTPIGPPAPPTAVVATAGKAQATVSWTAPASNGFSPITGYNIISIPSGATASAPATATSATLTGLVPGTAYTFTVIAVNAAGAGPASLASSAVTPFTTPGAPTGITSTPGNAQATVSWTAPASNGFSPLTGYTVTALPGGATASVAGTVTTATLMGLTNGTSYTFTVIASNLAGSSAPSAPSNTVIPTAPQTVATTTTVVATTPPTNSLTGAPNSVTAPVISEKNTSSNTSVNHHQSPSVTVPVPPITAASAPFISAPAAAVAPISPLPLELVPATTSVADPVTSTTDAQDPPVSGSAQPEEMPASFVTTTLVVDPTLGGELSSPDGALIVDVPAGAGDWLTVSLTELSASSADPENLRVGTRRYMLVVQDSTGDVVTTFDPALGLTFQPDMTSLESGNLQAAAVMALNPDSGAFDSVPTTVLGTQLVASLDKLGSAAPVLSSSDD